jgi:hypothetical protein
VKGRPFILHADSVRDRKHLCLFNFEVLLPKLRNFLNENVSVIFYTSLREAIDNESVTEKALHIG